MIVYGNCRMVRVLYRLMAIDHFRWPRCPDDTYPNRMSLNPSGVHFGCGNRFRTVELRSVLDSMHLYTMLRSTV